MKSPVRIFYDRRVHRVAFNRRATQMATLVPLRERSGLEALIALTDTTELHRAGDRTIVAGADDYVGSHREYVLAPFAYPRASRFSDSSFGIFYAAESRETAVREVIARLTRIYADGAAPEEETHKQYISLRAVSESLADVRRNGRIDAYKSLYDLERCEKSRAFGAAIRNQYPGLLYDSLRHKGGVCLAAFAPRILSNLRLGPQLTLVWDGARFVEWREINRV